MFGLQLIIPPTTEPVSLELAKQHLVIDTGDTSYDALITGYITAARQYCEQYTRRAFFNQTWKLTLDHFPVWNYGTTVGGQNNNNWFYYDCFFKNLTIQLPKPTVQGVTSVTYIDVNGTQQTLDPSQYRLDNNAEPARLSPKPGSYWPYTMQYNPGNVQIVYVAGSYGDGETVNTCPQTIVLAMLLLIGHWFQNREATSAQNLQSIPLGVDALLDAERLETFGFDC